MSNHSILMQLHSKITDLEERIAAQRGIADAAQGRPEMFQIWSTAAILAHELGLWRDFLLGIIKQMEGSEYPRGNSEGQP